VSLASRLATSLGAHRGRRLLALYVAGLVPALVLALAQPVWGRSDEAAQFDVVAQYAHGVYPKLAVTTIQPDTLAIDEATGVYGWNAASEPPLPADATFGSVPRPLSGWPARLWAGRHLWQYSYEALQPPVYYAIATPAWIVGNSIGGAWGAVYALRIFSALVLALMVPLVYLLAAEALPERPRVAVASALATGLLPGLLLNGAAFDNDTGAAVAGTVILLLCFRGWRRGWSGRRAAGLGLAVGIGILIKPDIIGLAPAIAIAFLHGRAGRPPRPLGRRLAYGILTVGTATACVAPWIVSNLVIYGSPATASAGQLLNTALAVGQGVSVWQWLFRSLANVPLTFFGGEFPSPPGVAFTMFVGALLTLAGVGAAWRHLRGAVARDREVVTGSRDAAGLLACAVVGCFGMGLALPLLSNTSYLTPGRYLYPAAGAVTILLALAVAGGWQSSVPRRAVFAVLMAAEVAAALALPGAIPAPGHTGAQKPSSSAVINDIAARGGYAGLGVRVDHDAWWSGDLLWVHVVVTNSRAGAVDWDPMPEVWVGGQVVAEGDYTNSSALPATLVGGEVAQGWIELVPTARVAIGSRPVVLLFTNVAADGYRNVGDLAVRIAS
jgi:hypothetical protein